MYILVSVHTGLAMVGILILLIFVDQLPADMSAKKKVHLYNIINKPFFELLQVIKDWRMLMITPMAIFLGMGWHSLLDLSPKCVLHAGINLTCCSPKI